MTVDKHLEKLKSLEPVKDEKEYFKKLKVFEKAIGGVTKAIKRTMKNPKGYINDFEETMGEGVRIGLINEDYKKEKTQELLNGITDPKAKRVVKEKLEKAKKFFGKK